MTMAIVACQSRKKAATVTVASGTDKSDTLRYIQSTIGDHKAKYLHQPLDSLLSNLQVSIRSFEIDVMHLGNDGSLSGIQLSLYDHHTTETAAIDHKKSIQIAITFEHDLNMTTVDPLYNLNNGNWIKEDREYFGKQKIKDFQIISPVYK